MPAEYTAILVDGRKAIWPRNTAKQQWWFWARLATTSKRDWASWSCAWPNVDAFTVQRTRLAVINIITVKIITCGMAAYGETTLQENSDSGTISKPSTHLAGPAYWWFVERFFLAYIKSVRKMRFFTDTAAKTFRELPWRTALDAYGWRYLRLITPITIKNE